MSCDAALGRVLVTDSSNRRLMWESCVRHINPGVDWLSEGNTASIRVVFRGGGLFTARINALAVTKPNSGTIQTRSLTPTLGYIQSVGIQLNLVASVWKGPVQTNTWSHLVVPGHDVVLVSVPIAGLGSLPLTKVCHHRLELYEGSMNKTVWRLCSRYRSLPQPHISYEGDVHVHFVFDQNNDTLMQGMGFRLIVTFHDRANIPARLTNGTWNCSTPTWQDFQQHFICDLVIHCAGGEDETDCPLYAQCGYNGGQLRGKCFSLIRLERGTTWHQANFVCSNLAPGGRLSTTELSCQPLRLKCNYQPDCLDGSDEGDCQAKVVQPGPRPVLPVIVDLEGRQGIPVITRVINTTHPYCPHTHYLCPSDGNCLPVFTRCNRVADCSGKEDERECENYVCPGLYRCRGQDMCVLPSDLCDGVLHCPQHDDERFCNLTCPDHCTCVGYAFVCHRPLEGRRVHQLRYLDAQGSGMTLEALTENVMLIYLNLARCNIMQITNVTLPNLITMDLSDNTIAVIGLSDLLRFQILRDVKLSGNPIVSFFEASYSTDVELHSALHTLDLSRVKLETLSLGVLAPFSRLQVLNLSQCSVKTVQVRDEQTSMPRTLRRLDAKGCDFTEFPRTLFQGVDNLKVVYADTYKLCCPVVLPKGYVVDDCHAPFDEVSSCDALLRSNFFRVCLFVLATFGLLGNSVSYLTRLCAKKTNSSRSGFAVFVQHLCLSDFLMGFYLVFIGVVDRIFLSNYLWEDTSWRQSAACKLAGFISLTSCEVSSFIISLITVDRFLVLRFPFSHLHFGFMSAQIASVSAWIVGSALAAVPLLPAAQAWQFYSQTGICIPLPVTRQEFGGQGYAFGVMIVLNFLLFILIAGGQIFIYVSIQAVKMRDEETSSKSHDAVIARRLITVAVSDFLCWFPIGLLGLLASSGTPVPGTVNVAMAIFVLPLNSALNPFLYTLNMLQERFQKRKEDRMLKTLMQQR